MHTRAFRCAVVAACRLSQGNSTYSLQIYIIFHVTERVFASLRGSDDCRLLVSLALLVDHPQNIFLVFAVVAAPLSGFLCSSFLKDGDLRLASVSISFDHA